MFARREDIVFAPAPALFGVDMALDRSEFHSVHKLSSEGDRVSRNDVKVISLANVSRKLSGRLPRTSRADVNFGSQSGNFTHVTWAGGTGWSHLLDRMASKTERVSTYLLIFACIARAFV